MESRKALRRLQVTEEKEKKIPTKEMKSPDNKKVGRFWPLYKQRLK